MSNYRLPVSRRAIYVGKEIPYEADGLYVNYGSTGHACIWGKDRTAEFLPHGYRGFLCIRVPLKDLYFPSLQPTRYCPKP